jgi:L-amino acid N-acyltransferase YncA
VIRLAEGADAEAIANIYGPVVAYTAISFEEVPPSAREMRERIAATLAHTPWLVLERAGQVAGFAYASKHRERAAYRWSVDATVYVHEAHRRHGVGRALYTSLFALLRLQGFHAVHAGITLPNAGSVRLHESMGFRPIGIYPGVGYKLGAWHDTGWWQLSLRDRSSAPAEPLSMAALRAHPEWSAVLGSG